MSTFKIGLLNFGEIGRTKDYLESLQEMIEYAQLADEMGYSRFWLGEHYLFRQAQMWSNPEVLIPIIAAATEHIKVGVAGSLINIHQPFDIATNYKLLANLFPGRIDLGFAKGRLDQFNVLLPSNGKVAPEELFQQKTRETLNFFAKEQDFFDSGFTFPPILGEKPDFWMLGSSYKNLKLAIELGANFSRSLFHLYNDDQPHIGELALFRNEFYTKFDNNVQVNLAVAACCSKSTSMVKKVLNLNGASGQLDPRGIVCGSPAMFHDQICELNEKYNIDEFILLQLYENQSDRLKGIELIAKEFNLHS